MKTRGKGKTDLGPSDLNDPRDFLEEGENTNGFNDDRIDDVISFFFLQKSHFSRALPADPTAGLSLTNPSNNL